jgi:hypothetical protein
MKLYNVNLTVSDEDTNEQLVQLKAPHLTGQQVIHLNTEVLAGLLQEPEPEIVTVSKPQPPARPVRKRKIRNLLGRRVDPPIEPMDGPSSDDIKDI